MLVGPRNEAIINLTRSTHGAKGSSCKFYVRILLVMHVEITKSMLRVNIINFQRTTLRIIAHECLGELAAL